MRPRPTRAPVPLHALSVLFLALPALLAPANSSSSPTQVYVVCKKADSNLCVIWKQWPGDFQLDTNLESAAYRLDDFDRCGLSDLNPIPPHRKFIAVNLPSDKSAWFFCNTNKLQTGTTFLPSENVIPRIIRLRRQATHRLKGRYRGQTQSQYLSIDRGNGKDEGKAEAHSAADSSRAIVSGNSGMGQAQSQTIYDPSCEECNGRSDPEIESLSRETKGPATGQGLYNHPGLNNHYNGQGQIPGTKVHDSNGEGSSPNMNGASQNINRQTPPHFSTNQRNPLDNYYLTNQPGGLDGRNGLPQYGTQPNQQGGDGLLNTKTPNRFGKQDESSNQPPENIISPGVFGRDLSNRPSLINQLQPPNASGNNQWTNGLPSGNVDVNKIPANVNGGINPNIPNGFQQTPSNVYSPQQTGLPNGGGLPNQNTLSPNSLPAQTSNGNTYTNYPESGSVGINGAPNPNQGNPFSWPVLSDIVRQRGAGSTYFCCVVGPDNNILNLFGANSNSLNKQPAAGAGQTPSGQYGGTGQGITGPYGGTGQGSVGQYGSIGQPPNNQYGTSVQIPTGQYGGTTAQIHHSNGQYPSTAQTPASQPGTGQYVGTGQIPAGQYGVTGQSPTGSYAGQNVPGQTGAVGQIPSGQYEGTVHFPSGQYGTVPTGSYGGTGQIPAGIPGGISQIPTGQYGGTGQTQTGTTGGTSQIPSGQIGGSGQYGGSVPTSTSQYGGQTPTGQYGVPGQTPTGQYGGPGQTSGQNGGPSQTSTGQYGAPGQSPTGQYGGQGLTPTVQYGGPGQTPMGQNGVPGQTSTSQFGGPGQTPTGQYGGPGQTSPGQYGGPGQISTSQYGGPGQISTGQYGGPGQAPTDQYGGPSQTSTGQYGGPGQTSTGQYGGPGQISTGQYGGPGQIATGQYGGPDQTSTGQYGGPGQTPTGQYGGQSHTPTGQYGGPGLTSSGQYGGPGQTSTGQYGGLGQKSTGQYGGPGLISTGQYGGPGQTSTGQHGGQSQTPTGQSGGSGQTSTGQYGGGPVQLPGGQHGGLGQTSTGQQGGPGQTSTGQYGGPGQTSTGQYAGPGQTPSGQYGGPGQTSTGQYGGPSLSPTVQNGGQSQGQTPSGQYGGPGQISTGQYGGPGLTSRGQYGAPGQTPTGQYGGQGQTPTGQYGGPGQTSTGQYGGPGQTSTGQYGGPGQTSTDQNGGPGQTSLGQYGGPGQTSTGQYGGPGQTSTGQNGGPGQIPNGSYGGQSQTPTGQYGGSGQTSSGQYGGPGQTPSGQYGRPDQTSTGQYGGPGQTSNGPYGGTGQTANGPYGGAGQTTNGPYGSTGQGGQQTGIIYQGNGNIVSGGNGEPQNVVDPNSISSSFDDYDSEAQANVAQGVNGTTALASSKGGNEKGRAQTQVEGTYSGTGSFSANAEISDDNKAAQSHVSGSKKGASSSAEGRGRKNKSQASVKLGSETGSILTDSQSSGDMHSSSSQVQGSVKGGMADAQAKGPGSTSSQAQIGFTPYKDEDKEKHDILKAPFEGGGTASAQSGRRMGTSQSQLRGTFKYGISYNGAAQAGSSLDKDAVFSNLLPFDKIDVFDENNKNIDVEVSTTEKTYEATLSNTEYFESTTTEKQDNLDTEIKYTKNNENDYSDHLHLDHHKIDTKANVTTRAPPMGNRRSFQSNYPNNGADYEYPIDKDEAPDEYEIDDVFGSDGNENAPVEQGEYANYDDLSRDTENTHQSLQNSIKKPYEIKQTTGGNTQHIILGSLQNHDAKVIQKNSEHPDETRVYQPGEKVPGMGGYTIPAGFTGSVKSVASKDKTYVVGSKYSPSQAQTVSLSPGSGKIKYVYPNNYGKNVNPTELRSLYRPKSNDNRYVSVSKSVTRDLDSESNIRKQYSHTYYTKSSSCGYFTFSCTMVSSAEGKKKVCKPKIPTNPDGTPMRC